MGELVGLAVLLAIGLTVYLGALIIATAWRLTHPPRRTYARAVATNTPGEPGELPEGFAFDRIGVNLGVRTIEVWRVPGSAPDGPAVVMTPGWGDSRIGGLVRLAPVAASARAVYLWDPPGLGETPGRCALGTRETTLLTELVAQLGESGAVVLYGWSMGAGVSIAAGSAAEVVGVIAEAPYRDPVTPARNVLAQARLPWRANLAPALWCIGTLAGVGPGFTRLGSRVYDRVGFARALGVPLLVIHGEHDAVCPVEHGRMIAEAAADGAFELVPGAGHNDLWTEPAPREACARAVSVFLGSVATATIDA